MVEAQKRQPDHKADGDDRRQQKMNLLSKTRFVSEVSSHVYQGKSPFKRHASATRLTAIV